MSESIQFVGVSPEDYRDQLKSDFKSLLEGAKSKEPVDYLTRYDIAKLFSISLPTVHNWTNQGILKSYQIGGRVYYKSNEVESALKEINI